MNYEKKSRKYLKLSKLLNNIKSFLVSIPIFLYKKLISPFLPHVCRFYPTCSTYAIMVIKDFGLLKGIRYIIKRLFSCKITSKLPRYNPIPINIKGDKKWLF